MSGLLSVCLGIDSIYRRYILSMVLVPAKCDWIPNWAPECIFVPAEWNCDYFEQSWL